MANSVTQEYMQIPTVTRAYTTACVLTTAAVVSSLLLTRVYLHFWTIIVSHADDDKVNMSSKFSPHKDSLSV